MSTTMNPGRVSGPVEPYRRRVPEGDCWRCGKTVRLYVPKHGDGSELHTYWHKDPADSTLWCRTFMDAEDARWVRA